MTKVFAAVAALVLVVVLVLSRHQAREAVSATPASAQPAGSAAAPAVATGSAAAAPGRIKKITPEQRRELEQKIQAARTARAHGATSTPPPSLPSSHEGGIENLPPGALDMLKEALPYLGACYGSGATVTGPHRALVLMSMHGDPDVGTLIDPGEMHDENGAAIDPEVASCLTSTLQSLQLPPMGDGDTVQLQFTFRY